MIGLSLSLTRAALPQAFAELNLLSPTLDPRITFTGGPVTYIGSDGLLHTSAANEWPLQYDPVTLLPQGRAAWEQRTNLLLNSATLATQNVTTAATTHTLSFTGTGTVTLSGTATGTLTGTGPGPANRVSLTVTATAGALTLTVTGTVSNANLEAAATAGPYIPTTTAQVTRAAQVATVNDLSTLRLNPAQGTLYVDYTPLIVDGTTNASVVSVNDGTTSNRWQVRTQTANVFGTLVSGGTDASRAVSGSYAAGQNIKAAIAFSSTGDSLYVNGVANTSAKTIGPLNTNILTIGYGPGDTRGSTVTPVRIRRVRYYPTRLTDAQLQAITT